METKRLYVADFIYGKASLNLVTVTQNDDGFRTADLATVVTFLGDRFESAYFTRRTTLRFASESFDEAKEWLDGRIAGSVIGMQENIAKLTLLRMELAELAAHDKEKTEV